ncbi:MAG: LamG-like jellyroll fold domain-containing protein, partial [Planctomycetota bacterium]|nr:LamG-like jellyroll fold domain-containing protein [Planctomycetota bacterium]
MFLVGMLGWLSTSSLVVAADIKLQDKTLVAWVRMADLQQKGAGLLSVGSGPEFDAITFAELAEGRWMAGSHNLTRTQKAADQNKLDPETASPEQSIFLAIVYRGKQVEIWRNGSLYTSYKTRGQHRFDDTPEMLFGLRCHPGGTPQGYLRGAIDEARIYDVALDANTIASMKPYSSGIAFDLQPVGLWTFNDKKIRDEMGNFTNGRLVGDAKVADGRLQLGGNGYAVISKSAEPSVAEASTSGFGMAASPFFTPREVRSGDTFPMYSGGRWHLFHMSDGCFGHSSSDDLVNWKRHPDTPFSGATGTVLEHDGHYYMFFTGPGQAVSMALSDDLDHWRPAENNPVVKSDGAIYQHGNFRDPYVFYNDEDRCWWMLIGAREVGVSGQRSGCVALAKSKNLLNWKLDAPLWAPRIGPHADCPQLLKHNDKWFLFYLQRFARYRTAESLRGPWQRGTRRNVNTRFASAGSRAAFDGRRWVSWPFLITLNKDAPEGVFGPWGYGGPLAVPREWEFHADD